MSDNIPASNENTGEDIESLKAELERWRGFSRTHEAEAKSLKREILVNKIASEKGLPENVKKYLNASSAEELSAQADDFVEMLKLNVTTPEKAPVVEEIKQVFNETIKEPAHQKPAPNPLQGIDGGEAKSNIDFVASEILNLFNN